MNAVPEQSKQPRGGVATALFIISGICFLACLVGFAMLFMPSTQSNMNELRSRAENAEYPQFLAPGKHTLELSEGMIWVSFFTDESLEGVRYQAPSSLIYELAITDASGVEIPVESDPSARATLPLDSDEVRKAVLIGLAEIPHDGTYTLSLDLDDQTTNKSVAQVIAMTAAERSEVTKVMTFLCLGVCGGGGAVFFGVLGLGARWAQQRSNATFAA